MDWIRLARVEVPANPVSLPLVKKHLREDLDDQDELILMYVRAAADTLEGPDGAGIALNTQKWDVYFDRFPCDIKIPIGPLQAIDSITYTDSDGAEQIVASADYQVDTLRGIVRPVESWPATDNVLNAVVVRFTAGYAAGKLPSDLQAALLLIVAHLFENREPVHIGGNVTAIPFSANTIIERYRRGRFA